MTQSPYANLQPLGGFSVPIVINRGIEAQAYRLAERFDGAYQFISSILHITPTIQLALLSSQDWPQYTQSPFYGAALYDYTYRTIVTGTEKTSFWQPIVELMKNTTPALYQKLAKTYNTDDREIDITSHVELWYIHDLGHACHLHENYWFPRKWLMELFASLCLYTYVTINEPTRIAVMEDFLLTVHEMPRHAFFHHSLQDFEKLYTNVGLENYLWYSGYFMWLARELYIRLGVEALRWMWSTFVKNNIHTATDQEITSLFAQIHPNTDSLLSMNS
jgi:hypothetical protein